MDLSLLVLPQGLQIPVSWHPSMALPHWVHAAGPRTELHHGNHAWALISSCQMRQLRLDETWLLKIPQPQQLALRPGHGFLELRMSLSFSTYSSSSH